MTTPLAMTATFTRRLREERRRSGLSQAVVAERLTAMLDHTVHPSAVALVEQGRRALRLDEALGITQVLGIDLMALLSDEDAIARRLTALRHALEVQQARALAAEHEHQQAQLAMAEIEHELADLETTRDA